MRDFSSIKIKNKQVRKYKLEMFKVIRPSPCSNIAETEQPNTIKILNYYKNAMYRKLSKKYVLNCVCKIFSKHINRQVQNM